jgi:hypothetical protein
VNVVYESNTGRYVVERFGGFGDWVPTQSYDTLADAQQDSDRNAKLFLTPYRVIDTKEKN